MGVIVILFIVEVFLTLLKRIYCENMLTRRTGKGRIDLIAWCVYFIVVNGLTYFVTDSAWQNMLITFLSFFLLIKILYIDPLRTLIVTNVFMYLSGIVSELLTLFMINLLSLPYDDDLYLICVVISRLNWFCIVKLVFLLVKMRRRVELNIQDWLDVFMVPFGSICILLVLVRKEPFAGQFSYFMAIFMVLVINIFTYYLYDKSKENMEKRMREKILENQCEYYVRQNKESQEWWEELRRFRHDMKQRYLTEKALLMAGNYEELERYCDENLDFVTRKNVVSDTGNLYVDSIINYKAEMAGKLGIQFIADVSVPRDAELNAEDLGICLGNLLDNAVEAVAALAQDRVVRIKISADRKNLFLNIRNKYAAVHKEAGKYLTGKENSRNHGLGLMIVRQIVDKYNGELEIKDSDGEFDVTALLFDFIY